MRTLAPNDHQSQCDHEDRGSRPSTFVALAIGLLASALIFDRRKT